MCGRQKPYREEGKSKIKMVKDGTGTKAKAKATKRLGLRRILIVGVLLSPWRAKKAKIEAEKPSNNFINIQITGRHIKFSMEIGGVRRFPGLLYFYVDPMNMIQIPHNFYGFK